jgi:hypothetical protein
MDGRVQGNGTEGIVPYILSVNSKNQIMALADTNVTYQQLNVLAAGGGGGTRYLSSDNSGNLSWASVAGGGIGGSGTLNYLAKFTPDGVTVGNSDIYDTAQQGFWIKSFNGICEVVLSATDTSNSGSSSLQVQSGGNVLATSLIGGNSAGMYNLTDRVDLIVRDISAGAVDLTRISLLTTDIAVISPNITAGTAAVFVNDGGGNIVLRSGAAPSGGISTIAIASSNGFAGSSDGDPTNVTLTISTSITGILKGNGTAISQATAADITGQLITGYVSGAGVVAATDTILQAINKLNGNIAAAGTVTSVSGTTNRITSSGGATPVIDISSSYVGQASITTVGTITTGVWNGTVLTGQYGGTGVANTGFTMSFAGNVAFTGAFNPTFISSASASYTLPTATSTLLANNLGITGGSTWISGTAVGDKVVIQATSNATHTAARDLITLRKNSAAAAATSILMTIGDGQGLNNDEVSIYTGVNSGTSAYLLRAGATFAYFNASSSLRLQIGAADIIQLSSTTATMVQGITISDAKNIVLNTTTGTKIGTATSQKLALWNKTPIVQPTTAITGATLVGGGGTTITATDTFGGYTLQQIAAIIINTGLAA